MTKLASTIAAVFLLALVLTSLTIRAEEKAGLPDVDRFKNKIVMVYIDRSTSMEHNISTEFITNARIEKIGDRCFVTGVVQLSPAEKGLAENEWRDGTSVGFPWDRINGYYAYSPEQFEKVYQPQPDEE
jgi:hypothetical protein